MLKQISVFIENKPGKLNSVISILKNNNVDIEAMSIADTTDFGIIRIMVKNPQEVFEILKKAECTAKINNVVGVLLKNKPGALCDVMNILCENGINIEYTYSCLVQSNEKAVIIFRLNDNDKADKILSEAGITQLNDNNMLKV